MKTIAQTLLAVLFAVNLHAEVTLRKIAFASSGLEKQYSEQIAPMVFKVTNNCMFGDFDAVKQDMLYSEKKKLIVSLESLATGEEFATEVLGKLSQPVTIKKEDSLGEVMQEFDKYFKSLSLYGEDFEVKFAKPQPAALYVLKVCKDSTGVGSCKNKPFVTVSEVLEQYKNPGRDFKPEDRVYYTQLLVIDDQAVNILEESVSKDNMADVQKYFDDQGIAGAAQLKATLENVAEVRSLPLNIHNNKLQVVLPSFDPIKCGQQQ